jgi:hypothetical protein
MKFNAISLTNSSSPPSAINHEKINIRAQKNIRLLTKLCLHKSKIAQDMYDAHRFFKFEAKNSTS